MKKYAIVGIGLIDSLGNNLKDNWNRYIKGDAPCTSISNYDVSKYTSLKVKGGYELNDNLVSFDEVLTANERRHLDRCSIVGLYSASEAIKQAKIVNPKSTAVMFSSLGGAAKTTLECTLSMLDGKRVAPRQALAIQRDSISGLISRKFGFQGSNLCLSSACASGILSLDYAVRLLEDDIYDQIVVGASDVMVDPLPLFMFQSIGALDMRDLPCSQPFDIARSGFVMGEGSATFVVKKLSKAIEDGDNILSIIRGIGFASDSIHETALGEEGARQSVEMAIRRSGLTNKDIDLINAHATSTGNGDEIEYKVLADNFPGVPTMALKANVGHTMSACGLIELAYMIESMNVNRIGPIANLVNPLGDKITLPTSVLDINAKYGIKNSFGFNGKSASIVIEKP